MSRQTTTPTAPAQAPFEWLGREPRKLRGDLRTIRKSVRGGWLDDPARRVQLLQALGRLDSDMLTPREGLQLAKIYLEMDRANGRDEDAEIEALREAMKRKHRRNCGVIVQDMGAWRREQASDT